MYLSSNSNLKLDQVVKSFEVAYRSKISESLISKYDNVSSFSIAINAISIKLVDMPIMYAKKFKAKADKIKSTVGQSFLKINDCFNAYKNKDYNNDVPNVSELLDYVNLFFNECFSSLAKTFQTVEEFHIQSVRYHEIRNSLSHPASTKIKIRDAKDCIEFIITLIDNIEDDKFWYISKTEIINLIKEFNLTLDNSAIKVHNLDEISFPHGKIVCRDAELDQLRTVLLGKDITYRRSGSVVLFGYGGVGKTALVLEFISQILKDIGDKKMPSPYDFILFFTSKEETLSFKYTTGEVYIDSIQRQIESFDDFRQKMDAELKSAGITEMIDSKGLIVVDNFETLTSEDKTRFLEFIRRMPRSVQFILTSRNEEYCEDKINVKEFKDSTKGVSFIDQYIKANDIKLSTNFHDSAKRELVELSKGNTLIIVLTIHQLAISDNIKQVLGELRTVESSNMEIIADFMYKNTIQHTIEDLSRDGKSPIKVLKVLSLYGEPIDLYSISILAELPVSEVEKICQVFTSRLVLDRIGESYAPNEFANRFILLKYLPNNVEKRQLSDKIREKKRLIRRQSEELEENKKRDPGIRKLMEDWKPKHIIDKIAIAESYSLVGKVDELIKRSKTIKIHQRDEKIQIHLHELINLEKRTAHPYIRMQHARILMWMYELEHDNNKRKKLSDEIFKVYDEAIMSVQYNYSFIINTKSFASINWKYGLIHANVLKDYEKAARYMEDAMEILRRIKLTDREYYRILSDLSLMYKQLYLNTKDKGFLKELKGVYEEVLNKPKAVHATGFNTNRYLEEYGRILNNLNSNRSRSIEKKQKTRNKRFRGNYNP